MNFYTDEHGRRFQYRLTMNMHPFRARMPTRTRSTAGQTAPERCMIGWSPAMARPPLPPRTDPTEIGRNLAKRQAEHAERALGVENTLTTDG